VFSPSKLRKAQKTKRLTFQPDTNLRKRMKSLGLSEELAGDGQMPFELLLTYTDEDSIRVNGCQENFGIRYGSRQ